MVTKRCMICGHDFDARYNWKTCSEKCSAIRDHRNRQDYYLKNSGKWKWYQENAKLEQLGTSNIVGTARKHADGTINVKAEKSILLRELKRLGLG